MQRKALKQLNKVTQWTSEKVFHGDKTELSREFTAFEQEIDVKRSGIERLHATSMPFFENITKLKPSADPNASKKAEKVLATEALGLVMSDYGGELRDDYGDALSKYGRARCKLAIAQQEFGDRLNEGYIAGMARSLDAVNDYKTFRKKLDSRRLALDGATSRLNGCKKEKERAGFEAEVELARERFEEIEEETFARMQALQDESEQPFHELSDLLEAELEYHSKCREILEELRDTWPSGGLSQPTTRPRANTASSARSIRSGPSRTPRTGRAALDSDNDDAADTSGRHRSGSTSSIGASRDNLAAGAAPGSAKKEKKGFMGGFGSFGKKGGMTMSKPRRDREAQMLNSTDDEEYEEEGGYSASGSGMGKRHGSSGGSGSKPSSPRDAHFTPRAARVGGGDDRSLASSPTTPTTRHHTLPPSLRRTHTSPPTQGGRYVKAIYDYATTQPDELPLKVGQVIEVKGEISADWLTGESGGRSGMFPAAYCEAYTPSPTSLGSFGTGGEGSVPVPLPPRRMPPASGSGPGITSGGGGAGAGGRTLPPITTQQLAPPQRTSSKGTNRSYAYNSMDDLTSGSDAEGFDDGDHNITASLSGGAQSPASRGLTPNSSYGVSPGPGAGAGVAAGASSGAMGRSRSSTVTSMSGKKGPAPPPPPSRRSASSTNVFSMASAQAAGEGSGTNNSLRARAGTVGSIYNGRLGVPGGNYMMGGGGGGRASGAGMGTGTGMDSSPEGSPFAGPASGSYSHSHSSASSRTNSALNVHTRSRAGTLGAEASPFGVSEDEREMLTDVETEDEARVGVVASTVPASASALAPAPSLAQLPARPGAGAGGMTRAMSGLKLPSASDNAAGGGTGGAVGECKDACGCDEFKQNLFKPKRHCASCYHVHDA